jgi:hypothetical protein
MTDKNQSSDLSETIRKLLCSRPHPINFILKNRIVTVKINADYSPINTGERSAFSVFPRLSEKG